MTSISLIGNLTVDRVDGGPPRIGGTVYYGARAAARIGADVAVATRCAAEDRDSLVSQLEALGLPVTWSPGAATTAFTLTYVDDHRVMAVDAVGDPWTPADVEGWASVALDSEWVHVGALLRNDFPEETLAALARGGRKLLVDAQGLVRRGVVGPLQRDGDVDRNLFRHLAALKLSEGEAEILAGGSTPDALRALGVPEVLLTLGSTGSLVVAGEVEERIEVTPITGATDPTGAGDIYALAYANARARGTEPVAAARAASSVVAAILARPVTEVLVACALGVVVVDLETEEARLSDDAGLPARRAPATGLPLVRDADRRDALIAAVVDRRPPLVISRDAGRSWSEAGAGLPSGVAVAISPAHPDRIVFAGEQRLFLSEDGGRFWRALTTELPGITGVAWPDAG